MCIYCGTTKYRKIYENHYGPIPKDDDGRSYEIHHIDGNHSNNDPTNLKCVTIQEHYDIHYAQGDYAACLRMTSRINITSEEKSKLARNSSLKRIENGTNPFVNSDFQKKHANKRIEDGTHHFLDADFQKNIQLKRVRNGTHHFQNKASQSKEQETRVLNGTHNFLGGNHIKKLLNDGTFTSLKPWKCSSCGKEGKGEGAYSRWHGTNCKNIS